MTIRKMVLTGTDCSGKTTAARILAEEFADSVVLVREAPTMLFGRLKVDTSVPAAEPELWQQAVTGLQQILEQQAEEHALRTGRRVLLCDRGIGDCPAYLRGGWGEFTRATGMRPRDVMQRYDTVLFFAPPDEETYRRVMRDSARVPRDYADVLALSDRTRLAWAEWREVIDIPATPTPDEKIHFARMELRQFLAA